MKSRTLAFSAVATLSILAAPSAHAVPTLTFTSPSTNTSAAVAAEAVFLAGLSAGYITETFESYPASRTTTYDPLTTSPVGTFDQISTGSTGGACNQVNGCVGLAILSNAPGISPFSGRFAAPPGPGNSNWLDSNDSPEMKFTLTPGFRAVGFYLTDPNDAGGLMTITGTDGTTASFSFGEIFDGSLGSGYVSYLTIVDPTGIQDITFLSGAPGDGYGIDTVTVGNPVPEPGTLLLVGGGVVALALRGRRKRS